MAAWGKRDDMVVHRREPFNAEASRGALAEGPITPVEAFYTRSHGPVPQIDPASWRLTIDGLVGAPMRLSLADLQDRFGERTVTATLQCAGNRRVGLAEVREIPGEDLWGPGAISTARWTGASLADVLTAAGMQPEAAHVAFEAPDVAQLDRQSTPFGASIPVAKALSGEVLLAWAMNGAPLPAVHGAPVRVIVPGWIGARSVKWVERITAQTEPSGNYFQATAYRVLSADADPEAAGPGDGISLGPVPLSSEILRPEDGAVLAAGPTEVTGYSFAGDGRCVARVDVSLDSGQTWIEADVDPPPSPWAWQHWRARVVLPAGETVITARAWDSAGAAQPESAAPLWNPKGYANTSWARVRVRVRGLAGGAVGQ
jgi:sulfite oxidase